MCWKKTRKQSGPPSEQFQSLLFIEILWHSRLVSKHGFLDTEKSLFCRLSFGSRSFFVTGTICFVFSRAQNDERLCPSAVATAASKVSLHLRLEITNVLSVSQTAPFVPPVTFWSQSGLLLMQVIPLAESKNWAKWRSLRRGWWVPNQVLTSPLFPLKRACTSAEPQGKIISTTVKVFSFTATVIEW